MEVLYRLRIDGNENSVMIKDGEIQYPVFMESLHAEEIFRNLLSSGYKFCGLPFDFRKDGRSITDCLCRITRQRWTRCRICST